MLPGDLELARQCQAQYDGQIPLRVVSEVVYSVVPGDNVTDIIFRGTSDIEDALRDLEALMAPCPFGRVHGGAWSGLQDVFKVESKNLSRDTLLRCSGHSLGAMEAGMFGCLLYNGGFDNIEVVTFESPRWADAAANTYFSLIKSRTCQNYKSLLEHDAFTMIPLHLIGEPYMPVPNCTRFWSAPTPENEYRDFPENIQAHSLKDCVIPGLERMFA